MALGRHQPISAKCFHLSAICHSSGHSFPLTPVADVYVKCAAVEINQIMSDNDLERYLIKKNKTIVLIKEHTLCGRPWSCSVCTSLNYAWRCAEHTSPNQNVFIVITWERYTHGANSSNLGVKLHAAGRNVRQLYPKQAHSNAGTLQVPSIAAQKRRRSFLQSFSL